MARLVVLNLSLAGMTEADTGDRPATAVSVVAKEKLVGLLS
jgi:hypothetical protein